MYFNFYAKNKTPQRIEIKRVIKSPRLSARHPLFKNDTGFVNQLHTYEVYGVTHVHLVSGEASGKKKGARHRGA